METLKNQVPEERSNPFQCQLLKKNASNK